MKRAHWFLAGVVVLSGGLAAGAAGCASFGGTPDPTDMAARASVATYDGEVFVNQSATPSGMKNVGSVLWEFLAGDQIREPDAPLEVHRTDAAALLTPPRSGLRVTWVGHSTLLVEMDGVRILTDPIWSHRASPVSVAGPARYAPTPLPIEALPPIDAVVISHDHYDHLDRASIQTLAARGARFYVPLGVGAHLARWEVPADHIVELDWWGRATLPGTQVELVATPARHFSGRSLTDRNETLWASWAFRGPTHRVYFGGDTGMFPGFSEIGRREGPFDLTLMPIGAYDARWSAIHLDPEQAVAAHEMVRGDVMLPIHWSTFNLALHDWFEPVHRLKTAAQAAGVPLLLPRIGQPVEPTAPPPVTPWWPAPGRDA
jgi:L-ascorbate metabolism protein UlaG (beta-lactamase superfamily)